MLYWSCLPHLKNARDLIPYDDNKLMCLLLVQSIRSTCIHDSAHSASLGDRCPVPQHAVGTRIDETLRQSHHHSAYDHGYPTTLKINSIYIQYMHIITPVARKRGRLKKPRHLIRFLISLKDTISF